MNAPAECIERNRKAFAEGRQAKRDGVKDNPYAQREGELWRFENQDHLFDAWQAGWSYTTAYECPYCGEVGGTPRTVISREYQGDSPHGGMVEWEEERCTLCAPYRGD